MAKNNSTNLDVTIDGLEGFTIKGGGGLRSMTVTGGNVTLSGGTGSTFNYPTSPYVNLVGKDSNGNPNITNLAADYNQITTSAGTTAFTATTPRRQYLTGTSNHTITLPNASGSLSIGYSWEIMNESSGAITINTFDAVLLLTLAPKALVTVTCTGIGTPAGTWDIELQNSEGVVNSEQFIIANTAVTLTNTTAAQKIFNSPSNGAVTVDPSTTYFFECSVNLIAISASTMSFGFAIGGVTLSSISWQSFAIKPGTTTAVSVAGTVQTTYNTTASNTAIVTAGGATTTGRGHFRIYGVLRTNAGGTVIPQVSTSVGATGSTVGVGSYFRIWKAGTSGANSLGSWT